MVDRMTSHNLPSTSHQILLPEYPSPCPDLVLRPTMLIKHVLNLITYLPTNYKKNLTADSCHINIHKL